MTTFGPTEKGTGVNLFNKVAKAPCEIPMLHKFLLLIKYKDQKKPPSHVKKLNQNTGRCINPKNNELNNEAKICPDFLETSNAREN